MSTSLRLIHRLRRMAPNLLITWDVDGTLLQSGGSSGNLAHKQALESAVETVYNVSTKVNDVPHAGCTDRAILRDMCLKGGVEENKIQKLLPDVIAVAGDRIEQFVERDMSGYVLPGVRSLLQRLQKLGVRLALTTGNLESCAWAKLKAAGLGEFFEGGAFGSDCFLREEILKMAVEKCETKGGFERRWEGDRVVNVFHVGDALADVRAARVNCVGGIGVLTGVGKREQFEKEGAVAVLKDLGDVEAFLKVVGLE